MNDLAQDTPFDQYSRQYQAFTIVDALREPGQSFTIIDVGGYKGRTSDFFPNDKVTVLDVFDVKEQNYIKGDGTQLPFPNEEFDFVLNFDVIEHLPNKDRETFLNECLRVSKKAAIFSAPNRTKESEKAELQLNKLYKNLHGNDHKWLKEHIDYKLPSFKKIEEYIKEKGIKTQTFFSNDTIVWTLMQSAIFINSKYAINAQELRTLNEYYNKEFMFDGGRTKADTYRVILVAFKDGVDYLKSKKSFTDINSPLSNLQKLDILEKIFNYEKNLARKLTQLSENYKGMYEHELERATQLDALNKELISEIDKLRKNPTNRIISKLKRVIKKSRNFKSYDKNI